MFRREGFTELCHSSGLSLTEDAAEEPLWRTLVRGICQGDEASFKRWVEGIPCAGRAETERRQGRQQSHKVS